MKIATWNVERLVHKGKLSRILTACEQAAADILVLTETDERICLPYANIFQTPTPPPEYLPPFTTPVQYTPTEHRVTVLTNYRCPRQYPTYDPHMAICVELQTRQEPLLVYGTIIGAFGNRRASFERNVDSLTRDIARLSALGKPICLCGDFNCSFADNYYFTTSGRDRLLRVFSENGLALLTKDIPMCIDHIAISEALVAEHNIEVMEWNTDKSLSDHKGIAVDLF